MNMPRFDTPLSSIFDDPDDSVNVIVNCSFELIDEGELVGWNVLEGTLTQVQREDNGHAGLLDGRVRSVRFETNARVPFEWTGEAKGHLVGKVHFMESERFLRTETFVHESADWESFVWRFMPPPNAERADVELEGDGVLVDNLYLDGLGAEEYTFLDNQAGFHPAGSKRVLIQSRKPIHREVRWELFDTLRGQTFAEGVLKHAGEDQWKRWHYFADFSDLQREGYYLLRVYLPDQMLESPALRIWNGVFRHLAQTVATYSYLQRCGTDIPGYHKACHTNDAMFRVRDDQERYGTVEDLHGEGTGYREVKGSWHDAGDYNKWFHYFGYVDETLALMHNRIDLPRVTYGGDTPDVLSEVIWGTDFFLKVQNPDGSFTGPICSYFTHEDPETGEKSNSNWAIFWEDIHEDAGAGEVMHPRTRVFDYIGHHPSPALSLDLANAFAIAARAVRGTDDARCGTYVNAARLSAKFVAESAPEIANDPYWVSLWYHLYVATDDAQYRERALDLIPVMLELQGDDGAFPRYGKSAFRHINVLMELLIDEPDLPMRDDILSAAEKHLEWLGGYTSNGPWNLTLQVSDEGKQGIFRRESLGRNDFIGSVAYTYALAGRLTGNRAWLCKAEDQIAWILGRNPHGICQMTDAGRAHPNRYHGWHNRNENDLRGALTGGIINGICCLGDAVTREHPWTIQPPGFPILSVRREDVKYSDHDLMNARHDCNEYWSLHHGGFQEAMSALAAAYAEFETPKRPKLCLMHSNVHGYREASAHDELFERCGYDVDRMNSDATFPHVDPRAYRVVVAGNSWVGSSHTDPGSLGIHVRLSWEMGKTWVLLTPSAECLSWVDQMRTGLLPDGLTKELHMSEWEDVDNGRRCTIGGSDVWIVSDEAALESVLRVISTE
jgi:hypothetical protein